jgi:hypothetical protein
MERLRPQTLRELLAALNPIRPAREEFSHKSLLTVLARDDTARTINAILSTQIERFLVAPIGKLADHMPEGAIEKASFALTKRSLPPRVNVCPPRLQSLTLVAWYARKFRNIQSTG